jgi:PAS domain S-box-containing protein
VVVLWAVSLSVAASATIHLALVFPKQLRLVDRWPAARFFPWIFCIALAVPAILEISRPTSPLAYITTWQAIYVFMAIAMVVFMGMLVVRIVRSDTPMVRQQSRVIIFGAALAFAPITLFYLLPTVLSSSAQGFRASIYFPLLILLPLSITYAILRYRLLDVDRLLANILTYTLMTGVVLLVFYGLVTLVSLIIRQTVRPDNPLVIALYLLALVLGLTPLRSLIQRLLDRLFYRAPADYRRVLNTISSQLVISPDLEGTLDLLTGQISRALAPEAFIIFLYDDDHSLYIPHTHAREEVPPLPADDPLVKVIAASSRALWLPPTATLPAELFGSPAYRQLNCTTFVPLRIKGKLIGFMALGLRRSGEPYSREDLGFLDTVAGQSALALENARLFTNLHRTLDQTLEMKGLMDDIFASIATGVITTDVAHKVTLFNQAAARILGTPMTEVVGRSLQEALPHVPDLENAACEAVENGLVALGQDVTPVTPSGALYLRLSYSPLYDAYQGTKGATIVIEDLTERRKLEAEQERIRQTFGRVVAPRVRDRLLSDPSHLVLDGVSQKATILFADICGFTSFSEVTPPEALFKILNEYLSLAAEAILEAEGTLDKFIGDAVMAFWNAPDPQPDHALRAVRAALLIMERSRRAHEHMDDPACCLHFRIGVATGEAVVGNVGTRQFFNYTAIGDTVNLAQRLEVNARPDQILIDQSTYSIVAKSVDVRALEPVQVKGKAQPVAVYSLEGLK